MFEKFMNLDPEKRKVILDAAFEEFADHSYEYASTNRIVEKAGISKGMLFYYFNSKKELFHYLISYGIEYVTEEYLNKIDESDSDFIERYRQITKYKMEAYNERPHIFNFYGTFYINDYEELDENIKNQLIEVKKLGLEKMFDNIDKSLFREDMDSDQVIRLINLTMVGYENEIITRLKGKKLSSIDYDPYWEEFDNLLDQLKKVYYK